MLDPKAFDQFIVQLMQRKGLTVTEADQAMFTDEIIDKINDGILRNLPDDKLPEFEQILEEGNEEKAKQFIRQEIPNLEYVVMKALA